MDVKSGHPDFLDLPWQLSINDWNLDRFVELPKAKSRHSVRFLQCEEYIYVIKELPVRAAQRDYEILTKLEDLDVHSASPIALVTGRHQDHGAERSAAIITKYIPYSLSYFELLEGPGFGFRRDKMLDAFASILVQLHLCGCFWGDCSLGNVLYRYDADGIEVFMIDAETSRLYPKLSEGQRFEDILIMKENIAGGMSDIAASQSFSLCEADINLGEDIERRYKKLWSEIVSAMTISQADHYLIHEKINRLNLLGFNVENLFIEEHGDGDKLHIRPKVGGRNFHTARLKGLTGIDALERQAQHILNDVHCYQLEQNAKSPAEKILSAAQWRINQFEPTMEILRSIAHQKDLVQAYCDLLYARNMISNKLNHPITMDDALTKWLSEGQPGYPEERYVL